MVATISRLKLGMDPFPAHSCGFGQDPIPPWLLARGYRLFFVQGASQELYMSSEQVRERKQDQNHSLSQLNLIQSCFHTSLIRCKSLGLTHFQKEEIILWCDYQEAWLIGGNFRRLPITTTNKWISWPVIYIEIGQRVDLRSTTLETDPSLKELQSNWETRYTEIKRETAILNNKKNLMAPIKGKNILNFIKI